AAKKELETARNGLVPASASVNKEALKAKENQIVGENLKAESYTPASWEALQSALANAKTVLGNPNATQAEVDAAKEALETARKGLVLVSASVDKAALQAKANQINDENLKAESYTSESWQALQSALANAKTVLDNANATQAEVDTALAKLTEARKQLDLSDIVLGKLDVVDLKNGNPVVLSPVFDGKKSYYEAVVSNAVYGVGIVPQALHPNSKITVTLNGQEVNSKDWGSLPLKEGQNVIKLEVADPNGKKYTYTVEILRVSSKLASLAPSTGSLNPAFDPDKEAYTMSVSSSVYQLGWTPVTLDPKATVEISVNGGEFTALTNGKASPDYGLNVGANTIVVKVTDRNGVIKQYTVTVTRASDSNTASSGSSGSWGGGGGSISTPAGIGTSVNGKDVSFAKGTTEQSDGRTHTKIQVDAGKLNDLLSQGNGQKLAIRIPEGDARVDGLTGTTVKRLADTGSSLEISSPLAIYPVPGKQLDLNAIAKQWNNAALGDIAVHVDIKRASAVQIESARSKATAEGYQLLVDPVNLDLTFTREGQTVRAGQLNGYAAKYIALPEGVDPNRITTGVIVYPDGTVFHVPTVVTKIDNRYFALINDLRSHGTYSVIWNPQDFDDVRNHWAKSEVNNIAARLDLAGTGNNTWSPDRNVSRSEFAAIVVSGLGLLRQDAPQSTFHDVASSAWHHNAVTIANEFGIVLGYEDGSFRADQQITREQGIAMIARAYRVINPQKDINSSELDARLSAFSDAKNVSAWAKEAVAMMIAAGIVEGKDGQLLKPQDSMTRAETAALIQRLLKVTHLID
ncbi:S-layer homology domain-containing protein, partial [Paenibacillus elgii]